MKAKAQAKAKAKAKAPAASPPPAVVVPPIGRPAPDSCKKLSPDVWWRELLSAVSSANEVELATYCFDDNALYDTLRRRLRATTGRLTLNIHIDREMLAGNVPRGQKTKLEELHRCGANIYVCQGIGSPSAPGAYHVKDCVVDRRVYFMGSANFTNQSRKNCERRFRMTGSVVRDVLEDIMDERGRGNLWDGRSNARRLVVLLITGFQVSSEARFGFDCPSEQ